MPHNDARSSLECSFINGLIIRLLTSVDKANPTSDSVDLVATISKIAIHRIHTVATELEKSLSEKACDFHAMRFVENSKEKYDFLEDIILIMDVIYKSLFNYCNRMSEELCEVDSTQSLSKNMCCMLMSTVGGVVFFQSQFQDPEISFRLNQTCGKIIGILSEMNQEAALFHSSQVLKKCLEPQAENRGNFYTLKCLQYLRLRTDAMMQLFAHIADSIDAPTNSGRWKKNAMLDMTTPLRLCIHQWLEHDQCAVRTIYSYENASSDHPSLRALLSKLEPWASGAKKRSSVWPLMVLLLALMPHAFKTAYDQLRATNPPVSSSKFTPEARILKKTLENLKPSAMQSVLQKDSALFTELSVISLVLVMKVAATLQRHLTYVSTSNSSMYGQSYHALQTRTSMVNRSSSGGTDSTVENCLSVLWAFVTPSLEKLRDIIFTGTCPSHQYYSAIATSPSTVYNHVHSGYREIGGVRDAVVEITPESLLDTYLWSLFYGDQPKYLHLMMRLHGPHTSPAAPFARVGSLRALSCILSSDYTDRLGRTPTWRLTAASEVRTAVLDVIAQFRLQFLKTNELVDKERDIMISLEDGSHDMWLDNLDAVPLSRKISDQQDARTDADPDVVAEVLRVIIKNPWFVFVRRSLDEQTSNIILPTVFTSHLTVLIRDIVGIVCMESEEDNKIANLAEEALVAVVSTKYICQWTPKDPFNGVLNIHAIVLKYISCELLHCGSTERSRTMRLLRCMLCLLTNVNEYIGEEDLLRGATSSTEVVYALVHVAVSAAEAAILIHFCSGDTEIISLASTCLGALCIHNEYLGSIECRIVDSSGHSDKSVLDGLYVRPSSDVWPVYREMSASTGHILSIKLQQKSIRSYLSSMPCRTQGMNWALYAVMHRWVAFNKYILNSSNYPISQYQSVAFDEWTNYTGFLCALGDGLQSLQPPCTDDYLSPILCAAATSDDVNMGTYGDVDGTSTPNSKGSDVERDSMSCFSPEILVRSLLHLILLQHTEKRVAVDAFIAIGMYLTPSLIYVLFQELCVLLDLLLEILTKRCEAGTLSPGKRAAQSPSPNNSRNMINDFDSFISDMTIGQINGFVNAVLTMLQLIFDREWQKTVTATVPAVTTRVSEISPKKDNNAIVERMLYRVILIVIKLQRQLELVDAHVDSGQHTMPGGGGGSIGEMYKISPSEHFRLKKKISDLLETFLIKQSNLKTTTAFRMRTLNALMDWTYDCVSHLESIPEVVPPSVEPRSTMSSKRFARTSQPRGHKLRAHLDGIGGPSASESHATTKSASRDTVSNEDVSLYKSTELACVKAVSELLRGLELTVEAEDDSTVFSPAPSASFKVAKNVSEVDKKSKVFFKYFHVLQSLLLSSFQRDTVGKNELSAVTTEALCNLLHANMGIGLKHMVEAASIHENQILRGALLRVFAEVLSRRVDMSFGSDPKIPSYEDALYELMEMLLSNDRELARLLCVSARGKEAEEVSRNVLLVFESHNSTSVLKLLDWTIEHEVMHTARLGSLFRSESMGTKLMGSYFSTKGREYLAEVLTPPIQTYLAASPNLEVDPNKGVDAASIPDNMENLQTHTQAFLDAIVGSTNKCPMGLKHILRVLREETVRRFSATEGCDRIAVAGYMFLRFFCPAIAMPGKFGLTPSSSSQLNRQQSRGLLLIAKILQNLANGTHFFEECMEALNPWIDRHATVIAYFSYEISTEDCIHSCSEDIRRQSQEGRETDDCGKNPDEIKEGVDDADSDSSVDEEEDAFAIHSRMPKNIGTNKIPAEGDDGSRTLSEEQQGALISIHKFLFLNQERMERILAPAIQVDNVTEVTSHGTGGDISTQVVGRPRSVQQQFGGHYTDYPVIKDKLMDLMSRLGEPPEEQDDSGDSDAGFKAACRSDSTASECATFMAELECRPRFALAVEAVRNMSIFYSAPPPTPNSSSASMSFFFICRRVISETDPAVLLYIMVNDIRDAVKNGFSFDIIIDSSSFNTDAELPMWSYSVFWGKLKSFLGNVCSRSLRKVYVMYPSIVVVMSARKVLKKWGVKTRSVMDKVEVLTPSQLLQKQPHLSDKIPSSTCSIESGSQKKWHAMLHEREVTLCISGPLLIVQTADKFGGVDYKRSDILSLLLIDNVSAGTVKPPPTKRLGVVQADAIKRKFAMQSKNSSGIFDQAVVITYTASQSTRTLKLYCSHGASFLSALSVALTQVRQQRALEEASKWAGTRVIRPDAIPGMLLHVSLLNLFSETPATRKASFLLLCQMKETYHLPVALPTDPSDINALFIPTNLLHFAQSVSTDIAASSPEYGKEFLYECFQAIKRSVTRKSQKMAVAIYLAPWLPLLELFYQQCVQSSSGGGEGDATGVLSLPRLSEQKYRRRMSSGVDRVNMMSPSLMPAITPTRRPSTNSTSFLYTNMVASSAVTPQASTPRIEDSKDINLNAMGGRVIDTSLEEMLADIEELFEISLIAASDDGAVGAVVCVEIWDVVATMPVLSSLALKYFLKRWRIEARSRCMTNKLSTARDTRSSTIVPGPASRKGSTASSGGSMTGRSFSFLAHQSPPATGTSGSNIPFSTPELSSSTDSNRASVLNQKSFYDIQGECAYCTTMCEVVGVLTKIFPVALCNLLVDEIHSILSSVIDIRKSKEKLASTRPRHTTFDTASPPSNNPKQDPPDDDVSSSDMNSAKPRSTDIPESVLEGVHLFFDPPSDSKRSSPGADSADHTFRSKTRRSSQKDEDGDSESEQWVEIVALLRPLLYMIFQNAPLLVHCIPTILHLCISLVSLGPIAVLPYVHAVMSSAVYALVSCSSAETLPVADVPSESDTSSPVVPPTSPVTSPRQSHKDMSFESFDANSGAVGDDYEFLSHCTAECVQMWRSTLAELNSDTFQLIFNKAPTLTMNNMERVVTTVTGIAQSSLSDLCKRWRESLWTLSLQSAAKTLYYCKHSSFFLVLGCLVESEKDVDCTLLKIVYESLMCIVDNCMQVGASEKLESLIRPILICLSKIVPHLPLLRIQELFWFSVLLILILPVSFLPGPIYLLHEIVVELLGRCKPSQDIEEALLKVRLDNQCILKIFMKLEDGGVIGVSFASSFSTSLASTLIRGLQVPDTRTRDITEKVLTLMMEHYQQRDVNVKGGSVKRGLSGYSAVLLALWGDISAVSQPMGVDEVIDRRRSTPPPTSSMRARSASRLTRQPSMLPDDPILRPGTRQRSSSTPALRDKSVPLAPISFFSDHNFPTNKSVVLFVVTLLSFVRGNVIMESEQVFILTLLLQTIRELPAVLAMLYEIVFSELSAAYNASLCKEGALPSAIFDVLNECLMSAYKSTAPLSDASGGEGSVSSEIDADVPRGVVLSVRSASSESVLTTGTESRPFGALSKLLPRGGVYSGQTELPASCPSTMLRDSDIEEIVPDAYITHDSIDSQDAELSLRRRVVETSVSGTRGSVSETYLKELQFPGLLEGPHNYALNPRGSCTCASTEPESDERVLCALCVRVRESRKTLSSAVWTLLRGFLSTVANEK